MTFGERFLLSRDYRHMRLPEYRQPLRRPHYEQKDTSFKGLTA
jgi:hypothetical protein